MQRTKILREIISVPANRKVTAVFYYKEENDVWRLPILFYAIFKYTDDEFAHTIEPVSLNVSKEAYLEDMDILEDENFLGFEFDDIKTEWTKEIKSLLTEKIKNISPKL